MKFSKCILTAAIYFSIVLTGINEAQADDLSIAEFCDLTIERMAFTRDIWEQESRSPVEAEMAWLWEQFNTTAENYLTFHSVHHAEVEAYLDANPGVRNEIESLGGRIDEIIEQMEAQ